MLCIEELRKLDEDWWGEEQGNAPPPPRAGEGGVSSPLMQRKENTC